MTGKLTEKLKKMDLSEPNVPKESKKPNYDHQGDPCGLCGIEGDAALTTECVVPLLEMLRDLKVEFAFALETIKTLEEKTKVATRLLSSTTGEVGEVVSISGAKIKIYYPKKPRVSWNSSALEGYAAAHPEILSFKTEKWAAPSVKIMIE